MHVVFFGDGPREWLELYTRCVLRCAHATNVRCSCAETQFTLCFSCSILFHRVNGFEVMT